MREYTEWWNNAKSNWIAIHVELHEDKIPYLKNFRNILINEMTCITASDAVKVYFRARSTRPSVTHHPEVVLHAKWQDSLRWYPAT